MSVAEEIRGQLQAAFAPKELRVEDDSALHKGHAGAPEGGESHFSVRMRDAQFSGMSRIERHRAVHKALGADLVARIHALALDVGP